MDWKSVLNYGFWFGIAGSYLVTGILALMGHQRALLVVVYIGHFLTGPFGLQDVRHIAYINFIVGLTFCLPFSILFVVLLTTMMIEGVNE